jgi:hypothetical protein
LLGTGNCGYLRFVILPKVVTGFIKLWLKEKNKTHYFVELNINKNQNIFNLNLD